MKNVMRFSLVFSLFLFLTPFNIVKSNHGCKWKTTFKDDFNGTTLDESLWSTQYPSGGGGERQFYGPDAFSLKDEILSITASKTPSHGYPYTSGIIITRDKFSQKYGRFEIRAKLPKGKGYWPAFWMLPAKPKFPDEIDVFENLGHDTRTIFMSNHWRGADGKVQHLTKRSQIDVDFSEDFHTFEMIWRPDEISWYVDGLLQLKTKEYIPDEPMFMLVNLAVGGKWPGNPDATTQFPGVMQVDYVRAYTLRCPIDNKNQGL